MCAARSRCALQEIVRARAALRQGRKSHFIQGPKTGVMRAPAERDAAGLGWSLWDMILSPHATWEYSWIRPPSRSRRRTRMPVTLTGGSARPAGGSCCNARCGR